MPPLYSWLRAGHCLCIDFKTIRRNGLVWRIHEAGEGAPVVLYHGFPDTPQSYEGITNALAADGHRIIAPYLRGYHPDTIVVGRKYDDLALGQDAIFLLDALGIEKATLVGHDWGASVVYNAATLAPDRVEAIVPIGIPHPKFIKPKGLRQTLSLLWMGRHFVVHKMPWADSMARKKNFAYVESLYARWSPEWKGPECDAAVARFKEAFSEPEVLKAAFDYYRAIGSKIDDSVKVKDALPMRALLGAGELDFGGNMTPYQKTTTLYAGDSDLLVVPDAHHWPHRENEPLFIRTLLEFLG